MHSKVISLIMRCNNKKKNTLIKCHAQKMFPGLEGKFRPGGGQYFWETFTRLTFLFILKIEI